MFIPCSNSTRNSEKTSQYNCTLKIDTHGEIDMPWWESGAFWGIAGIVAGFLISTAYFCIGKERISMKCHKTTRHITSEEIVYMSKIGFLSNNQLKNISKTTIKFTNSGNRTIEPSDYAIKEPLGVHISGHLYQNLASADNNNSLPTITPMEDNKYKIEFDFLKPKQSFSIALFHDGIATAFGELRSGKSISKDRMIFSEIHYMHFDYMDFYNLPSINFRERKYKMYNRRFRNLRFLLRSKAKHPLIFVCFSIIVYFVITVKPLLFAVTGLSLGILIGSILFRIKDFFINFCSKYDHKGGGV